MSDNAFITSRGEGILFAQRDAEEKRRMYSREQQKIRKGACRVVFIDLGLVVAQAEVNGPSGVVCIVLSQSRVISIVQFN